MNRLKARLTYSNVMVTILAVVVLGSGAAYAAGHLGKNSVGPKQLKRNAVTTAKIKNNAVTGAKIELSSLGTVPSASKANTADSANTLAAPEAWHEIGAPGQQPFLNGWVNEAPEPPGNETVGFYKDHEGVVHLKGVAKGGGESEPIFDLPPSFRPAFGRVLVEVTPCSSCTASDSAQLNLFGSGFGPTLEGAVILSSFAGSVYLDGITFRAES
jgi:hypothetical protein